MSIPDVVHRYFAAWNAHDADAIVATFAPGGTYEDPTSGGKLRGDAIGENAARLWGAMPDVRFDVVTEDTTSFGVAAQWLMTGTNHGAFNGLPPTGRDVRLPGSDFIVVGPEGIESVRGYFDAGEVPRQLGLQIVVQPDRVGPFSFGTATHVDTQSTVKPGAFSITVLRTSSSHQAQGVRDYSRTIAQELTRTPGFLGLLAATVGDRMVTVTAWEDADQPRAMIKEGTHRTAMPSFFKDMAAGGWTSTWTPERINQYWMRCPSCGQMEDRARTDACRCGAPLPDASAYF